MDLAEIKARAVAGAHLHCRKCGADQEVTLIYGDSVIAQLRGALAARDREYSKLQKSAVEITGRLTAAEAEIAAARTANEILKNQVRGAESCLNDMNKAMFALRDEIERLKAALEGGQHEDHSGSAD